MVYTNCFTICVLDTTKKCYKLACMDSVKTTFLPSQYSFKTWWKVVYKEQSDIKYNNLISIILYYDFIINIILKFKIHQSI
jgi:hypothetical protein